MHKHNNYVEQLVSQIREDYDFISTHLKISNSKRAVAEIDILAKKGKHIDIYEVKCSYRIAKAKKQLYKIRKILNKDKISCYFYCGAGDLLVKV